VFCEHNGTGHKYDQQGHTCGDGKLYCSATRNYKTTKSINRRGERNRTRTVLILSPMNCGAGHVHTYQMRVFSAQRGEFARQSIDRRGDHRVAGGRRTRGEQRGDERELKMRGKGHDGWTMCVRWNQGNANMGRSKSKNMGSNEYTAKRI
jgi:hypothetical protein